MSFNVCTAATSNMAGAVCKITPSNSQITTPINNFVDVIDSFNVVATTQVPILNNFTVSWYSGNRAPPMSSTVWDNRYWLALTTNPVDAVNDAVLVLNQNSAWASFDIHAGAFTQAKNNLYHADSLASGNIYLDNQGFADNGSPINAYIKTRTFGLGDFSADDYLYDLYPSALNTGSCAMSISYRMDGGGTTYSLGSPLLSEYSTMSSVRLPFPVDTAHQDFGQSIDFTFGTNDGTCDWQFYGFEGLFKSRPVQ
jgi:hypothetical protein